MADQIRDAAIEAAVNAMVTDDNERPFFRDELPPLVDAVLAVARPAHRAGALRDAANALDDGPWEPNEDEGIRVAVYALREQAGIEEDA